MSRGRTRSSNPETARRILAAAERIFADRGMAGARTAQIAIAAHANKAMLYYYFQDKGRLHRAVLRNLFDQLRASIEAAKPAPQKASTRCAELLAFVNGYFDFVSSHPNYPRLVQRVVMESGSELKWIARRYFRPFHRRLSRVIEEGITSGEFRRVDPHQTVITIIAITVFYFAAAPVLHEVLGRDALRPQAVEARRQAILSFLSRGLIRSEVRAG